MQDIAPRSKYANIQIVKLLKKLPHRSSTLVSTLVPLLSNPRPSYLKRQPTHGCD